MRGVLGCALFVVVAGCGSHDGHQSDAMVVDMGPGPHVGDPCTPTTACPKGGGGIASCRDSWPDGYCVVEGCTALKHECPGDPGMNAFMIGRGKCVLAPTPTCLKMCGTASDCRTGYDCVEKPDGMGHGAVKVCVPK